MVKGYIHSIETCGTVDGPGLRYVIFLQGCPMRCQYCHNPDTWEIGAGEEITADEVLSEFNKNRSFYKNGGITVTAKGDMTISSISFTPEAYDEVKAGKPARFETMLLNVVNAALKKARDTTQQEMAKMMQAGGVGGLFGK